MQFKQVYSKRHIFTAKTGGDGRLQRKETAYHIFGEHVGLQVFLVLLSYLCCTIAYATTDQTRKSWLQLISEMLMA